MNINWVARAASLTAATLSVAFALLVGCSREEPKEQAAGNPTDPAVRMQDKDYRAALETSAKATRTAIARAQKLADRMAQLAETLKKSEAELMEMPEYQLLKKQLTEAESEVAAARERTQVLVRRRMMQNPKELSK